MTSLRTTRMTSLRTTTAIEKKNDTPFYGQGISSNKQQSESSMTTLECVECEGMFPVEDTIIHCQYGEERNWCEECYEEKHTQCDCCEDFFFFEEMTDPMNCDHYYCEECADREFGTCEECEEACSSDAKYCPDCVEKEEKKISILKKKEEEAYKIERLLLKEIKASKRQQYEQVKMENTMESEEYLCSNCGHIFTDLEVVRSGDCDFLCGYCWDSANVKKIEVQNKNTDRSILQEEDEKVKMENTRWHLDLTDGGCVLDGNWCGGSCPHCDPSSFEDTDEDSGSDEEHAICEECFGEMMEQMGDGVGEENGYYQCPALSPYEIKNCAVGDLTFCEKHYNKMVEEEKNQNLHLQNAAEKRRAYTKNKVAQNKMVEEEKREASITGKLSLLWAEEKVGYTLEEAKYLMENDVGSEEVIAKLGLCKIRKMMADMEAALKKNGEGDWLRQKKEELTDKANGYTQEEADLLMGSVEGVDRADVIAKLGAVKIKKMMEHMEAALIKKGMGEWLHQKKEEINTETEKSLGALQEEVVASGGKVIDASKMTRKEIDELTKEMEAKGFSSVEIKEKGAVWCVMEGCGRSCRKKNDAVGLAHRSTPTHTYPEGSWVCGVCWEEKGLCNSAHQFGEEDGVKCLGCSYTFGEKGFVKEGYKTIPANMIDLIKPSKKNPDYWCGMCLNDVCRMADYKDANPDDEFAFVGRTAGADDGFEPIDELRAKGKNMNKEVKDHCGCQEFLRWAGEDDLARMKGMMEYNDMFLTMDELLKVMNGWRFVINKDARIREWKKGNEAEKAAAELVANAAMFVEEKKEKPKTKKQIQAEATKAANQAVKDKKKAAAEYEKAVIECAKRQAESERLKKEKKYRAKMAKEKAAKKAAEKDAAVEGSVRFNV